MQRHKVKLIPNIITLVRVLLIPLLVFSFYLDCSAASYITVAIFSLASLTDYFDGTLARRLKAYSRFGRMLDPIADKMLITAALMMLVEKNIAPVIPAILILCREIFISGMREYLAGLRVRTPVSKSGKVKTALQMAAIILLLLGSSDIPHAKTAGIVCLWSAAFLTISSGYSYFRRSLKHLE